jgi:tetratricopeptide (TPR) repeat protein
MEELPGIIARRLLRLGNIDEASRVAEAAIARLGDIGNTRNVWRLRFIRAEIMGTRGHLEDAVRYLESLAPPGAADAESLSELKMYLGSFWGSLGRYDLSHRCLDDAERIAQSAGSAEILGETHLCKAYVFFLKREYSSSDTEFRSVLAIAQQLGGWYFRGYALWGIGKNLMIQEHYQEAVAWLEDSLRIFETARARLAIAMVWSELAVCHLGLGEDEKAMELLRNAERVNYEAGFVHNYQVVLANIGNVYLHRGDHLTAIAYYRRALALAREIKDPVSIRKWTRNINLAYARIRLVVDQQNPRIA